MHLSTRSSAGLGDIPNAAPPSGLVATETAKPGLILRSDSQRNGTGEALSCGERLVAIRQLRRERRLNGLAEWLAERFPYI